MPSIIDITMAYRPERKPPGARTTAILLAAGQSTRMGAHNKLLLDVGGQPMVRRVAETLLASRIDSVLAVLGHEHTAIAEALEGLPLRTVFNPDYAAGQMSSVRAGIEAISEDPAAIVVALADQPALEPADIDFSDRRLPGPAGTQDPHFRCVAGSAATRSCCRARSARDCSMAGSISAAAT
jgi:GTP:adenosylcobinamide-phosphate guanylyltransferase